MNARPAAAVAAALATFAILLGACTAPGSEEDERSDTAPVTARQEPRGSDLFETRPDGVRVLAPDANAGTVLLDPGRYAVQLSGSVLAESDIPEGWAVSYGRFFRPPIAANTDGMMFVARAPENATALPAHPCLAHTCARVGPTVGDLAEALADQPFFEVEDPAPALVGELPALLVQLTVPADADMTRCDEGLAALYRGGLGADNVWFAFPAGGATRLWVLEVFGARYVIHAQWAKTRRDIATLTRIVESTTFTRG